MSILMIDGVVGRPRSWDGVLACLDPELRRQAIAVDTMIEAGTTSVCAALRAIADWDAADRLPSLTCPAVVIAGAAEVDLDRQAVLAQLIGARFEALGDVGHLGPLETPPDVARAVGEIADAVKSIEPVAALSDARGSS